ncbi:MAG: hypothetical protein R2764_12150 [Bacteroidales bacterium]
MKQFFRGKYGWASVYHHFRSGQKMVVRKEPAGHILEGAYRDLLDLSSVQLDGTHPIKGRTGSRLPRQEKGEDQLNMLVLTDSRVSRWPAVKLFQENIMMRIQWKSSWRICLKTCVLQT